MNILNTQPEPFMTMPSRSTLAAILLFALSATTLPSHALDAPAEGRPHILQLASGPVPYRATWAATVLKDGTGVEQATISSISYVRTDISNAGPRPVIFAFNGGPGASSSPLHTGILGPRRQIQGADGKRTFVDNPDTLLDVADLVMIDPVGTGFNRELTPGGKQAYLNAQADAKATELLVRAWLSERGRTNSPVYIVGESYGGYRLALMSKSMTDMNIAGLVMVSPAFDLTTVSGLGPVINGQGNDLPYIFDLPTMAVTAWRHGKVQSKARTASEVFEEARAFAQGDFAAALQLGTELPPVRRDKIAQRMSDLIGIDPAAISKFNLRVPTQEYRELLLPGKVIGRVDSRAAAPKPDAPLVAGRGKAADDPALGMGKSNVIKAPALAEYLRNATGYQPAGDYISLSLELTMAWDWRARTPKFEDTFAQQASPALLSFMEAKPQARLLMISGYYDFATTALAQRYSLTHLGLSPDRYTIEVYAAGHTVYEDSREETAASLRRFVTGGK